MGPLLFSLVKVDSEGISLGLAVCDDKFSAKLLRDVGVTVMTWEEVRSLPLGPRGLIMSASKVLAQSKTTLRVPPHREEAALKHDLTKALHLRLPETLDRRDMDFEVRQEVQNFIAQQRRSIALFREVAVSRFINLSGESDVSYDEQSMYDKSSVDILVHTRPPHNVPILVIEYDGHLHWTDEKKIHNDKAKDALFERVGLAILRIRTNEARAASFQDRNTGYRYPVDPRLAPLLDIARAIVRERITKIERQAVLSKAYLEKFHRLEAISRAIFGKSYSDLTNDQREHISELISTNEGWPNIEMEMEYDWDLDDLFHEENATLHGQLAVFGVPSDLIDDFAIMETARGRIAKGRMRVPNRNTVLSIETACIMLRAPGLPTDEIERLVLAQLHTDFADQARRRLDNVV